MASSKALVLSLSTVGIIALAAYAWHAQRGLPLPWQTASPSSQSSPVAPAQSGGASAPGGAMPIAVEVASVVTVSMPDEAAAVGNLRSNESVMLRPEVSGRISAIHFQDGQSVTRGQLLVELDAAVQRAELQQARANLELAESNFRRTADLFERNFVSLSAREEAASRLAVARATAELAGARLERMRIVAPFSGTVGIRDVSVGDYVKDGDPLVNLEDIATLKLDFRLPEAYLQRIRPGQAIDVVSDTLPGERFSATLTAINPQLDAQGRAAVVRAEMANPEGRLRPGMFARVRVLLAERPSVTSVPEEAIVPSAGEGNHVYRVVDGKVERVPVRTGVRRGTMVEIVEGLSPGEEIVTAGQLKLRDGVAVQVVSPAQGIGSGLAGVAGGG